MKRGSICCSLMLPVALICSLCLGLAGCIIVPIRMKTSVKTAAGEKLVAPVEAPVPGVTTRQQVEEKFKAFAVDSGTPGLFWGQFQKSSWAVFAGSYGFAGASRVWGTHNLLVTFDEKDIAKTVEFVPQKNLLHRFVVMHKEGVFPPLDLSNPIHVEGMMEQFVETSLTLELDSTGVTVTTQEEIQTIRKKPKPRLTSFVPIAQVEGMHIGDPPLQWSTKFNDTPLDLKLKFSRMCAHGKSIAFYAEPQTALTLVRWIEQTKLAQVELAKQ